MIVRMKVALSGIARRGLLAMLLSAVTFTVQAQQEPKQAAQQSAASWLELVDSGKYAESWQSASTLFKAAVTPEQWKSALHASRDPLGKLLARKLTSSTYKTSVPGAPDGQYVVIRYDSTFEHKQSAVETITPMLDKDGKWRISGYYIK
jgi:Protein of unknown function (DUF4019)